MSGNNLTFEDTVILKEIGRGGSGLVYLVKHKTLGKVVLKLSSRLLESYELIEHEAGILKSLRHQNIVAFYGYQLNKNSFDVCGLFLERVKYGPVDDFIGNFLVTQAWKMQIIFEVALAMSYLHGDPNNIIIHGDLKCKNILIGNDFHAKVCDFGLTRIRNEVSASTTQSGLCGTPGYIPPEYFVEQNKSKTWKYDVYSYAIVVWEIFYQKVAYEGMDICAIIQYVLHGGRPKIGNTDNIIPAEMEKMIVSIWNNASRPEFFAIREFMEEQLSLIKQYLKPSFGLLREQVVHRTKQKSNGNTDGSNKSCVYARDLQKVKTFELPLDVQSITVVSRELFVAYKGSDKVDVYDACTFELKARCSITDPFSMAATVQALFISGRSSEEIHRFDLPDKKPSISSFSVGGQPNNISITKQGNLLLSCTHSVSNVNKLCIYTPNGTLLKEIVLAPEVEDLIHAVQIDLGRFIIIADIRKERSICSVDIRGYDIVIQRYGGALESGKVTPKDPCYLAVDQNGYVLAAYNTGEVALLSSELVFIKYIIPYTAGIRNIKTICFDKDFKLLYVSHGHKVSIFKLK